MSYNVLADVYTNSDFSRNTLFKHCPEKYLDYDYRKLLLTKELIGNFTIAQLNKYFIPLNVEPMTDIVKG